MDLQRHRKSRSPLIISLHPHNERCTGIPASELGLLAGADRIEGPLFGNGERTSNVDVVTVTLNMYMQGIDPKLDCSDLEPGQGSLRCSRTGCDSPSDRLTAANSSTPHSAAHARTRRQGSEGDRVAKNRPLWDMPYLPIDPNDIGHKYEAIIASTRSPAKAASPM